MEIWKVPNWNVEIKIGIKPEVRKLSSVNVQTNLIWALPKLFPNFLMMMRRLLKMLKSFIDLLQNNETLCFWALL